MKRILNGIEINFRFHLNDSNDNFVLLLHGWGGNLNSFRGLEDFLISQNFSVINLDFPGFGASEMPKDSFNLNDYVLIVEQMLETIGVKKVKIVAHSFGGRVAIKLASSSSVVEKLILVDSAGIKPKFSLKKYFKVRRYKFLKWLKKHNLTKKNLDNFGSSDFKALPEQMKPVFVRIVNEDLSNIVSQIACPTLIVWGEKDQSTPLYMAKILNKKIKDSGLIIYKDAGHFSYLEHHNEFLIIVEIFFK